MWVAAFLTLDHLLTVAGTGSLWLSLLFPVAIALDRRRKWSALLYAYLLLGLIPWPQPKSAEVLIDKTRRQLTYRGKIMRIGLGNHPQGPKQEEGDGKTPEGFYRICGKASDSPFGYWLGLDYPNRRDAWRGRLRGQISWLELTHWNWFWRGQPPQSTRLGGQIGIHGGGSRKNWTLGCIALEGADIKELFENLPVGTVVEIRP